MESLTGPVTDRTGILEGIDFPRDSLLNPMDLSIALPMGGGCPMRRTGAPHGQSHGASQGESYEHKYASHGKSHGACHIPWEVPWAFPGPPHGRFQVAWDACWEIARQGQ